MNYDMTLNSEKAGVYNCVKIIEQYLLIKGLITPEMITPADHAGLELNQQLTGKGQDGE